MVTSTVQIVTSFQMKISRFLSLSKRATDASLLLRIPFVVRTQPPYSLSYNSVGRNRGGCCIMVG